MVSQRVELSVPPFIRMKSGTLNSNLWLTMANLMGVELESYADSHGVISELWA